VMTKNKENSVSSIRSNQTKQFGLALLVVLFGSLPLWTTNDDQTKLKVLFAMVMSVAGYVACIKFIPLVKDRCLRKNLGGRDINKNGSQLIPEALGIVPGTVYLIVTVMFQPFFEQMLGQYNAALTSTCFMIFLGFADDVLDLRWALKIFSSFLAALPLLVAYTGSTTIVIPKPLNVLIELDHVNLSFLYHVYMALMAVFSTNSINIFAGVNGLEAGQSFVIACAVLVHNSVEIDGPEHDAHLLSFFLILPFMATTLGLLFYNWYPSEVFVGDTYTYFAGMTLAVAGILGHFTKTLMMFFLPQILNFLISLPQLFNTKYLPCPRHRLPKFNPKTGKLECVKSHWTLINLFLFVFGPMRENQITFWLLVFQAMCCAFGFFVRYYVVTFIF